MHTKRMPQHPLFNDINKNQRNTLVNKKGTPCAEETVKNFV